MGSVPLCSLSMRVKLSLELQHVILIELMRMNNSF